MSHKQPPPTSVVYRLTAWNPFQITCDIQLISTSHLELNSESFKDAMACRCLAQINRHSITHHDWIDPTRSRWSGCCRLHS